MIQRIFYKIRPLCDYDVTIMWLLRLFKIVVPMRLKANQSNEFRWKRRAEFPGEFVRN